MHILRNDALQIAAMGGGGGGSGFAPFCAQFPDTHFHLSIRSEYVIDIVVCQIPIYENVMIEIEYPGGESQEFEFFSKNKEGILRLSAPIISKKNELDTLLSQPVQLYGEYGIILKTSTKILEETLYFEEPPPSENPTVTVFSLQFPHASVRFELVHSQVCSQRCIYSLFSSTQLLFLQLLPSVLFPTSSPISC